MSTSLADIVESHLSKFTRSKSVFANEKGLTNLLGEHRLSKCQKATEFIKDYGGYVFTTFLGEKGDAGKAVAFSDFKLLWFSVSGNAWISLRLKEIAEDFDPQLFYPKWDGAIGLVNVPVGVIIDEIDKSYLVIDGEGGVYRANGDNITRIGYSVSDLWRYLLCLEMENLPKGEKHVAYFNQLLYAGKICHWDHD